MRALLPERVTWATWVDQFTDVALWQPAIAAVWAMTPSLRDRTGLLEGNVVAGYPGTCAVFVVAGTAVVKFFPPFAHQDYARELYCLRHLSGVPHRPELLATGVLRDRIDWPYLVTRFEPGRAWRDQRSVLPVDQQRGVAAELGRTLRVLHDQPLDPNPLWPSPGGWAGLLADRLGQAMDELTGLTDLPGPVIREAADRLEVTDWWTDPPVIVHADVTEDHVLIEPQAGRWRLSGLIDWADAEAAGPTYEWVALWFGFCGRDAGLLRDTLAAYDSTLALDGGFTRRLLAYTLLHRFGPRIIAGVVEQADQRACQSLADLRRRLFPGLP